MNAVVLEEPERGTQCCDSSVETILSTAKAQRILFHISKRIDI